MITVDVRGYDTTVVAFSGLAPRNHLFEWTRSLAEIPANFVGVRDPHNAWYQIDTAAIAQQVAAAIRIIGGRRTVCIGGSAGGFAAIMFGRMLRAHMTLAFSPQSACGAAKRSLGDMRWDEWCMHTPSCDLAGHWDNAIVHYAADDRWDAIHAGRLMADLREWPTGGHDVARMLKEQGALHTALMEAVAA